MADIGITIIELINNAFRNISARPLNLGGFAGSGGGGGGPPGGFVGQLPQTRVAYDTSELENVDTPISGSSILDNLNHIRYDIANISGGSGIEEAPIDGLTYGRKDAGWIGVTVSGVGIEEAPIDGTPYSRQDADWVAASGGGGGSNLWERAGTVLSPINVGDSISLVATISSATGIIYKDTIPFIHDFTLPGTDGQNTFIGPNAGNFTMTGSIDTQGSYNTIVGYNALHSNTTGFYNTALGVESLYLNTEGYYNTALGAYTLRSNTIGYYNTAVGVESLYLNTEGYYNTALGADALYSNTIGQYNTALGAYALYSNTATGQYNTAIGTVALYYNTTGYNNSAIGVSALYHNTEGTYNNALGYQALFSNTIGGGNNAIGVSALCQNTEGSDNIAIGTSALYANTIGYSNAAIGLYALRYNTEGYNNYAIGENALRSITTGYENGAMGYNAGRYIANGSTANQISNTSLYLGSGTKALANGDTNEIVIGYNTIGLGSNTVVIGNSSIVSTTLRGNLLVGGAINAPIVSKTAGYTATALNSTILCDATSTPFTVALPTSIGISGRIYIVKKIDSSANAVTISGYDTQTIDGSITMLLESQWATRVIQSDNANWVIIGSD